MPRELTVFALPSPSLRSIQSHHPPNMSLRLLLRPARLPLARLPFTRLASSSSPIPPIQDPYPLPFSPSLHSTPPAQINSEENNFEIPPLDRSHEDIETTRKRLIYQTRKRGMLEGDLLLATFARDRLDGMSPELVREFDQVRLVFPLSLFSNFQT